MGTAFVGCPESSADQGYRAALASALGVSERLVRKWCSEIEADAKPAPLLGDEEKLRVVRRLDDLGIHHLLRRLSDGPELAHFVESQLQPLLDHDAKSSSPLPSGSFRR